MQNSQGRLMRNKFKPTMTSTYFDYDFLSQEARQHLISNGFYLQNNKRKIWFSEQAIFEYYIELGKDYKKIPVHWWKKLNLHPDLRKQIQKIFKQNSDNTVVFCYAGDELD
jgi:hypothetical protein